MNGTNTHDSPFYHVQSTAAELRDGYPYFTHHESVKALWETKWRALCAHGIYPFTDAKLAEFDEVFQELEKLSGGTAAILKRPDDYAAPFLPIAEELEALADLAESEGSTAKACELFLRAAAVYRIARFPINRSPQSELAWQRGKAAYEKGGKHLKPPSVAVEVPFIHGDPAAGDASLPIQAYLRVPTDEKPTHGWPVVLFICGLDAYKTDHTPRTQEHVARGCATLSFEIPGTGDCPAAPNDPNSPDRLMSSVLDWVRANAVELDLDPARIIARGISTGGYYAMRIAHTHADQLFAVVAQGGGCHHMFDPAWIDAQDQMEYPFQLAEALAYKFGYREGDAVSRYREESKKFSLVNAGLLDKRTCKLLVINGMEDSIFPVEDSFLVAVRGDSKDLVARGNRGHMGNPGAEEIVYTWIGDAIASAP